MLSITCTRETLRQLTDCADDLIFVIDNTFGVQYLNTCAMELFRRQQEQFMDGTCVDVFPESALEVLYPGLREIFESGSTHAFEGCIPVQSQGVRRDTRLTPFMSRTGGVIAILGIARDVTERKSREQRISHSRREWLRVIDGMPYHLAVTDDSFRIDRVNASLADAMGLSYQELIGLTCYEKLHGTDRPPDFCPLLLNPNGDSGQLVEICETHLGRGYTATISGLRNEEGKVIGCIFMGRASGPRHNHNQPAKRCALDCMKHIVRSADYLLTIQDLEGRYVFFNSMPAGTAIPWDIAGKTPYDFFPYSVASKTMERISRVARSRKEIAQTSEIDLDGEVFYFHDRAAPLRDKAGNVSGVVMISKIVHPESSYEGSSDYVVAPHSTGQGLTARECEILRLIAAGLTNRQIAENLVISKKTVETHRSRIMQKLGTHKASALVQYAMKLGMLSLLLECSLNVCSQSLQDFFVGCFCPVCCLA